MKSTDSYSSNKIQTKKQKIETTKEGIDSEKISLASWGKHIAYNYIRPINNIVENSADISDVSDRSLSPILYNQLKICTCDETNATCDCIKYRKTKLSVTPDEMTLIDSDTSTRIDFNPPKINRDFIRGVSNRSIYRAFQEEEKRGTNFIFDVDSMFSKWDKENVKIGRN